MLGAQRRALECRYKIDLCLMKILINEKWNYYLVKGADKYSLTVVLRIVRIYEKKIILKNNEIQLYIDTGKKWIDKKLKIFENRNKETSYTRLFYIFN